MKTAKKLIQQGFDFRPGTVLAGKFQVLGYVGGGWEGEVYLVREKGMGIERAAKFFYPQRNLKNRATRFYARKLHKLRHCPILIRYLTQEQIFIGNTPVTFLVSEYVEGELLSNFIRQQKGKRLEIFEALLLLHSLARGVEEIHRAREYHGDLHLDNVIIRRRGISFFVRLVDMYNWGRPDAENIRDDVCDLVRIFYDSLGGERYYSHYGKPVKDICCGLKRSLILKKFKTAGQLREFIESLRW